jgi:protein TonB
LHPIVVKVDPDVPLVKFEIKDTTMGPSQPTLPHGDVGNTRPVIPATMPPTAPMGIAATHTTPDYPPMSRRLDEEGAVRLKLSIAPDGNVNDASVEKSSGFLRLDDAAVAWVKMRWRFRPATREGKPIPSSVEAVVTFQLKKV